MDSFFQLLHPFKNKLSSNLSFKLEEILKIEIVENTEVPCTHQSSKKPVNGIVVCRNLITGSIQMVVISSEISEPQAQSPEEKLLNSTVYSLIRVSTCGYFNHSYDATSSHAGCRRGHGLKTCSIIKIHMQKPGSGSDAIFAASSFGVENLDDAASAIDDYTETQKLTRGLITCSDFEWRLHLPFEGTSEKQSPFRECVHQWNQRRNAPSHDMWGGGVATDKSCMVPTSMVPIRTPLINLPSCIPYQTTTRATFLTSPSRTWHHWHSKDFDRLHGYVHDMQPDSCRNH
ncbi:hypothetical protein AAG906_034439 [Vitis piasezkii]